jgi:DNA-binding NarL/FixJ family response regulator
MSLKVPEVSSNVTHRAPHDKRAYNACQGWYSIIIQHTKHKEHCMPDLRILIVADYPLARAGLATLVIHQPGCSVVGQMAGHADVLGGLRLYQPDVVVWDLGWEPTLGPADAPTGLEHLADVRDTDQPVVALLPDERYAALVWASGVRGLLLRDVDAATFALALPAVARGLWYAMPRWSLASSRPGNHRSCPLPKR